MLFKIYITLYQVPVPEGLDLDSWINDPPSESEQEEESSDEEFNFNGTTNNKKKDFK
jgi:hypothetical protein